MFQIQRTYKDGTRWISNSNPSPGVSINIRRIGNGLHQYLLHNLATVMTDSGSADANIVDGHRKAHQAIDQYKNAEH
ncbi:hypothetical protein WA026_003631 [Henosepilachna vigintioctopunctata]|uniref:Uncharacterized protein n=1 Tax=Henosepilachna vigintioctopunctata TaxID=420089 RepID=A0AAW1UDU4_9CUCU